MIVNGRLIVPKIAIMSSMLYFLIFINLPFRYMQYVFILLIGLFLVDNCMIFIKTKYMKINGMLLTVCAVIMIVSYIDRNQVYSRNVFLSSILFVVILIESFLLMEYAAETTTVGIAVSTLYFWTVIIICLIDIMVIMGIDQNGNYLVGSKFDVTYLHILLIAFFIVRNRYSRIKKIKYGSLLLVYIGLSIFISLRVSCNTGLMGSILIIVFFFLIKKYYFFFRSAIVYIAILFTSCSFMYIYDAILGNVYVQDFVTNILGRTLTLTGRTYIYERLPKVLSKRLWIGYGYGSTYSITSHFLGYANTQNGIAEWIMQIGVVGTIILILFMYLVLKRNEQEKISNRKDESLLAFLYVMSILASIEITLNNTVWAVLSVVFAIALDNYNMRISTR